jgi:hypothetical protein
VHSAEAESFLNSFKLLPETTTTAGGQKTPAGWVKVTIPEGPIEVVMPRKPSRSTKAGEVTNYYYEVEINGDFGYRVVCSSVPSAEQVASFRARGDAEFHLKAGRDRSIDPGYKLFADKSITSAGHPGRDWQLETGRGIIIRYRTYLIDDRQFLLSIVGRAHEVQSSDAEAFLNSFKLLPGKPTFSDSQTPTSRPSNAGVVQLFNGKDLTGWKTLPQDKARWEVKDGRLIGSGPVGHLYTERDDYQDFHLTAEARINNGGNSGVYFRSQPKAGFPPGYEAQINSNHRDPVRTGSLHPANLSGLSRDQWAKIVVKDMLVAPGEWFTQEVIAKGSHIIIKINGKTTVDFIDDQNTYTKGHFALQQHHDGSVVEFRKIEVKELSPGD